VLVLLGTAGVVGLATAYDAWRKAFVNADGGAAATPAVPPVVADRAYANDDYIPGVGYYHAPYHGWFPFPFNYHDPARGYYAGGFWQAAPWLLALNRSQPSEAAVASALAARRASSSPAPAARAPGIFGGTGSGFSSGHASGTAPAPSIIRGGFGSSGHFSGS
jgi:hypothetical protein